MPDETRPGTPTGPGGPGEGAGSESDSGAEPGAGAGSHAGPGPGAGSGSGSGSGSAPPAGRSGATPPATPAAPPAAPSSEPPGTWDTLCTSLSDTVGKSVKPFTDTFGDSPPGTPPGPSNPVKAVSDVAGGIMGMINLPLDLINTGIAVSTNFISQALPSFPAATLGALYVGIPHGHVHPPSLIPPATVPVPLPSLGPVTLGTCVTVLISGLPAARAGDIGFAPTCGGFYPVFEVFTGSSKVFIGGGRAARMLDMCKACQPAGPSSAIDTALSIIGPSLGLLGAASDAVDAVQASDAEMASAMALSASMKAAQAAADAVAEAIKASMGSDPAATPTGGMISMGAPNVLVGGFPMPNIPNPVIALLKKGAAWRKKRRQNHEEAETQPCGCPGT